MTDEAELAQHDDSIENRYYAYLRGAGYSTTTALDQVLARYVPLFDGHAHVGDLGAGHGEFLALLVAQGHTVAGVDIDPAMAARCRDLGFDVAHGDALEWLASAPEAFDGLFSSNVIEHLPAQTVEAWIAASFAALKPGGILVLATPNPESLIVQFHEFWRDPTHVRMYSRQLLEFLLTDAGFSQVASHENPASDWEGIDVMLEGVNADLARAWTPEPPPIVSSPEPSAPADAPWRARIAWRMSHFVHAKFLEPWLAPLRRDIESDRARVQAVEQAQRSAIDDAQNRIDALADRVRRLAAADRFAYPAREIYVTGYKPGAAEDVPASALTEPAIPAEESR